MKNKIIRTPFKPSYPPSSEQEVIFSQLGSREHLHIEASPGSGKSTTLVWSMTQEKSKNPAMLAFSKAIVEEIEPRCAEGVKVATAHSYGYSSLAKKFGRLNMVKDKVETLIKQEFHDYNPSNFKGDHYPKALDRLKNLCKLADMARVDLIDETNEEQVDEVIGRYDIDIKLDEAMSKLPLIFQMILKEPKLIDFTDMMWMPIRLGIPIPQYDCVYVDERQDLNNLMMEYVSRMASGRVITCGDSCQSIFAFCGSDPYSTERLIARFPGKEMNLSTCYRCGTDIVKYAQGLYPKIQPFDKNPLGEVIRSVEIDMNMPDGSMILARRNAALVKPCFDLIKAGRKAIIKGRDIGYGLIKLIDDLKATSLDDLGDKLDDYQQDRIEKLMAAKRPKTLQIEMVQDKVASIESIMESCSTVSDVKNKINLIFSSETQGITLSSAHRSKGLEANEVTIVDYSRIELSGDKMTEVDKIQEKNVHFVAVTRAKNKLTLVS